MLLDCLKPNIPPRNNATPQYYTCFGRVHVKIALQFIIIVTFAWDFLRWLDIAISQQVNAGWIEIVTEVCDALFGVSLAVAYCYESAPFLLPYLFTQLFTLVISVILFCVCLLTMMWPNNPWASSFYTYLPAQSSRIRLNALIYSILPFIFTLILIWVIRVLLACYVYFNDKKKTQTASVHPPVITNEEPNDLNPKVKKAIPSDLESGAATVAPSASSIPTSSVTFSNPNFSMDDEDEENEDQLWPQGTTSGTPKSS